MSSKAGGESFRGNVRVHKKKSETTLLHVLCYITFVSNGVRLCVDRLMELWILPQTREDPGILLGIFLT